MAQEKWLVDGPKTIDVENVSRLKVALVAGQIDIIGHDEPGARVEVHSVSGRDLKISIEGDTLEIDHPQVHWDNFLDVFTWSKGSARAEVSRPSVPRGLAPRAIIRDRSSRPQRVGSRVAMTRRTA